MAGDQGANLGRVHLGVAASFVQAGIVAVASGAATRIAEANPDRLYLEFWNPDATVLIFFGADNTIAANVEPFVTPQCSYYFGRAPAMYTGEVWVIHALGSPMNIPVLEY